MNILAKMQADRDVLAKQLADLDAALATVRRYLGAGTATSEAVPQKRRATTMSPAQRKAVSQRMKAYWKARKAGKGR